MASYSVNGPGGSTSSTRTEPPLNTPISAPEARRKLSAISVPSRAGRVRIVDSRPSRASVVTTATRSGSKPSARKPTEARSTQPATTAAAAGSWGVSGVIGTSSLSTVTAPDWRSTVTRWT